MASVSERGGRWYVRYRDASGKWVRQVSTADTKTAARRLASELERRAERQRLGLEQLAPENGGGTLAELLQWWLETYSKGRPSHARNVSTLRKHLIGAPLGGIATRRGDVGPAGGVSPGEERVLEPAVGQSPPHLHPLGLRVCEEGRALVWPKPCRGCAAPSRAARHLRLPSRDRGTPVAQGLARAVATAFRRGHLHRAQEGRASWAPQAGRGPRARPASPSRGPTRVKPPRAATRTPLPSLPRSCRGWPRPSGGVRATLSSPTSATGAAPTRSGARAQGA